MEELPTVLGTIWGLAPLNRFFGLREQSYVAQTGCVWGDALPVGVKTYACDYYGSVLINRVGVAGWIANGALTNTPDFIDSTYQAVLESTTGFLCGVDICERQE
jgi:hypothetical protein